MTLPSAAYISLQVTNATTDVISELEGLEGAYPDLEVQQLFAFSQESYLQIAISLSQEAIRDLLKERLGDALVAGLIFLWQKASLPKLTRAGQTHSASAGDIVRGMEETCQTILQKTGKRVVPSVSIQVWENTYLIAAPDDSNLGLSESLERFMCPGLIEGALTVLDQLPDLAGNLFFRVVDYRTIKYFWGEASDKFKVYSCQLDLLTKHYSPAEFDLEETKSALKLILAGLPTTSGKTTEEQVDSILQKYQD